MMSCTLVRSGSMGNSLEEEQKQKIYSGHTQPLAMAHFWCETVKRLLEIIHFHSGG